MRVSPVKLSCHYLVYLIFLGFGFGLLGCGGTPKSHLPLNGKWYVVKKGDTIQALSTRFKVELSDLIELNHIKNPSLIQINQALFIPHTSSHTLKQLSSKSSLFTSVVKTDFLESNKTESLSVKSSLQTEQGTHTHISDSSVITSSLLSASSKRLSQYTPLLQALIWPIKKINLSSPYGPRSGRHHHGIDLRAPKGTPTFAVLKGTIKISQFNKGGYGWYVEIDHGHGLTSRYAHHLNNKVKVGQVVQKGDQVGEVGSTGRSSGPHLHFELRVHNQSINPLSFLPALP